MSKRFTAILAASAAAVSVLQTPAAFARPAATASAIIPSEVYTLPNGLRVVTNIDRSDPVVSVALVAHVGSAREVPGRTGFAHMFEHLFFLNSENLGPGGLDKLSARIGGEGANGYTNLDQTVYLQTVPKDALEKMLWAEADKLGYFINTVTPAVVAKEIQVVKNEKRQSYDNQPYGQLFPILQAALYPPDHPYSWTTIGSLADLDAATLDDVKQFYRRWYVPNNATLVISGDFDPAQTRRWVEKYFGEIPRGQPVALPTPRPAKLTATKRLMHLDGFAKLPQVVLAWPSVPYGAKDDTAVTLVMKALTDAPDGPVYRAVVEEAKLSDSVSARAQHQQLAGAALLIARGFAGVPLDRLTAAIDKGIADFEKDGLSQQRLDRIKALYEAELYEAIGDVRGKTNVIATSETMARKPDGAEFFLAQLRKTTVSDVMRAYRTYLAGRPRVEVGFVPKDQPALALSGAQTARVVEETIVQGAEKPVDQTAGRTEVVRTASSFDRTVEPPAGPAPVVPSPAIWTASLANGMGLSGIVDRELPVTRFEITLDGGQLRDDSAKPGTASLAAQMLLRGTEARTRQQFETALQSLGSTLSVAVSEDRTIITGTTLARNFAPTLSLVEEALTRPRWDEGELALAKSAAAAGLQSSRSRADYLAQQIARQTIYAGSILANDTRGTPDSVAALTVADLKAFAARAFSPSAARLRVVGDIDQAQVANAAASLGRSWQGATLAPVGTTAFTAPDKTRVLFYDVPGAKQSAVLFVRPGPARSSPDWFDARSANYILGGGGFASRLTQELREGKGYTYSIGSRFDGTGSGGRFTVSSPVRANVTLEAAMLMRDLVRDYGKTFTAADLALTRDSLTKARARQFESLEAKMNLLALIGDYGLPKDFIARENAQLAALDAERVRSLADRFFDTDRMLVVVVGDAKTQAARLNALGFGQVEMVPPMK